MIYVLVRSGFYVYLFTVGCTWLYGCSPHPIWTLFYNPHTFPQPLLGCYPRSRCIFFFSCVYRAFPVALLPPFGFVAFYTFVPRLVVRCVLLRAPFYILPTYGCWLLLPVLPLPTFRSWLCLPLRVTRTYLPVAGACRYPTVTRFPLHTVTRVLQLIVALTHLPPPLYPTVTHSFGLPTPLLGWTVAVYRSFVATYTVCGLRYLIPHSPFDSRLTFCVLLVGFHLGFPYRFVLLPPAWFTLLYCHFHPTPALQRLRSDCVTGYIAIAHYHDSTAQRYTTTPFPIPFCGIAPTHYSFTTVGCPFVIPIRDIRLHS